ncbi:MAG TPA: FecR family protein [Pyrinomonadaceae bacterium]|jgi:hypothetical protein
MKNVRNLSLGLLLALLLVSAAPSPAAAAPASGERDQRVISARAGGVNYVSGDVKLRRAGDEAWRALTTEDELKSGDTVRTGAGGRVEVLLNPGSYFRAGSGAEFALIETSLDELRVELARGGAVIEAMGYGDSDLSITVATPRAVVRVIRTGVYRVNALADGGAEAAVFEGRLMVGETVVKGGQLARAGAVGGVEVTKFDRKKSRDELDIWSRDRGKELARANEKLQRRAVNALLARSVFDDFYGRYGSRSGFWFYDDRALCYTFLPFGSYGRSPYGFWYGTGIVYYPQRQWPTTGGGGNPGYRPTPGTGGGGGGATVGGGSRPPRVGDDIRPPSGGGDRGGRMPSLPRGDGSGERAPARPRFERNSDNNPRQHN